MKRRLVTLLAGGAVLFLSLYVAEFFDPNVKLGGRNVLVSVGKIVDEGVEVFVKNDGDRRLAQAVISCDLRDSLDRQIDFVPVVVRNLDPSDSVKRYARTTERGEIASATCNAEVVRYR